MSDKTLGMNNGAAVVERTFVARDQIPESVDAAEAELAEVKMTRAEIQAQLSMPIIVRDGVRLRREEYDIWRSKAVGKMLYLLERQEFLKQWIKDQRLAFKGGQFPNPSLVQGPGGPTSQARHVAKTVGMLESVFVASQDYLREDTPENRAEWARRVDRAGAWLAGVNGDAS